MLDVRFQPRRGVQQKVVIGLHLFASVFLPVAVGAEAESPAAVDYDRQIRPIISDRCYKCHGPDAEARQADLRLDRRDGIADYVIVPGDPENSELIARIISDDATYRMPPPESHLTLRRDEQELIRRWIAEGAKFTEHWSFRPLPARVDAPRVAHTAWPRQTLDRFVLARLEAEAVAPSPPARPLRLLRRISLDLTGLPPRTEEVQEFERTAAVDFDAAYERAVDRLLASPAFGEHLAVAWLDAVRYADSYGYQSDQLNTEWPYRDWVVRALNANLPYDEFITWQLAGDQLANATRDQILATAFNRLHRMTNEGGSLAEEWLVENCVDRVNTVGTALLGLTVECARCHDHKFDPITMRDYYSLFAFFNSIDENGMYDHATKVPSPSLLLPTDEQTTKLATASAKISALESAIAAAVEKGEPQFQDWLTSAPSVLELPDLIGHFSFDADSEEFANEAPGHTNKSTATELESVEGIRGPCVRLDGDRGIEFPNFFQVDRWDAFTLDLWIRDLARNPLPVVVLQRTYGTDVGYNGFDVMLENGYLEVRIYRVWPGNGIGVRAVEPIPSDQWQHLAIAYDGSSRAAGIHIYLNGEAIATHVLRDRIHKSAASPAHGEGHLTIGARFRDRGFKDGEVDEFRVFERALTPVEIQYLHDGISLNIHSGNLASDADVIRAYYFSAIDPTTRKVTAQLREARRRYVELEDTLQEVPVMDEMAEPRPAYILARGAYDAPRSEDKRVGRDTFEDMLLPFPDGAPRNRLGLAQWITDPNHPLTARVFVNRLWANFFGRGLVATPENFGRQGAAPTHPELLDWLARDFVEHGWDIKRLCRQIVLSATYRQDSRLRPELREKDPENGWLASGPSRRLSGEQIRDVALAASGLLQQRAGGPPVSPYQPGEDLWRESNEMSPPYRQSVGIDLYRRSIYSVWKRTSPLPNMTAFDAPTREVCVVSRGQTDTPLQALVLLNDVQFVEAARALAASVTGHSSEIKGQISLAFLRLTGRRPDGKELRLLESLYHEQHAFFLDDPKANATALVGVGDSPSDTSLATADLAALTVTCQAILNLDATIYER